MTKKIKISLILTFFLSSPLSFAEDYLHPNTRIPLRSILHIDFQNQFYYTDSNFLSESESWTGSALNYIDNNNRIILTDHKTSLIYRPMKWIQIIPHLRVKNFYNTGSTDFFFNLTEIGATLNHPIRTSLLGFLPSFEFVIPLDKQQSVHRPILSDETIAFNLSLLTQMYLSKKWVPFGKVAFQYRGRDLLSLFQGQAGLKYRDHIWELGALFGIQNFIPIQNPPSQKSHLLNQFNSGSLKYFVRDPFAMGLSSWADFRVGKKTHLLTILSADLNGINYAQGFSITFGVKYKFIGRSKRKIKKYRFQEKVQDIDSFLNQDDQELLDEIEKLQ